MAIEALLGFAALGGLTGVLVIPLMPWNRAWTWERYKAFFQGRMPIDGF